MSAYADTVLHARTFNRRWAALNDKKEAVEAVFGVYDAGEGESPESWWTCCVYVYSKSGKCSHGYNPLQDEKGGLVREWLLPPTDENLKKISDEIERLAGLAGAA